MTFDENESEPLTTLDTENKTRLNPSEGRSPSQDYGPGDYWERLSGINTGVVDSFGSANSSVRRTQERLAAWDIVSEMLAFNSWQKQEGRLLAESLSFGPGGFSAELHLGVFCIAAHVLKGDPKTTREYHPRRNDENNCPIFLETADHFDLDADRIHSVLNKVSLHAE